MIAVSVSSAVINGTGIEMNQMVPIDENSRLCPVDEWASLNKGWTSVTEQLQSFFENCAREIRLGAESVAIEPCADLGELKEMLETRFRLRAEGPNLYTALGPMIFVDWVRRPTSDRQLEKIKFHLAGRCRFTCALAELSKPRDESYAASMYGISDAVLIYCDDRKQETATSVQRWVWQFERKRHSTDDRPKCIAVLDFGTGTGGLSRNEFAGSLPNGESVMVIGGEETELDSLFEPLWRRIGA